MRTLRSSFFLVGIASILLVVCIRVGPNGESASASLSTLLQPVNDPASLLEFEDVERRDDWFYFQRTYPYDGIPAGARDRAWAAREMERSFDQRLAPAASTWAPIGPRPTTSAFSGNWGFTSGRITSIAISPANPDLILIGSASGGIWRSTDAAATFDPVADNQVDLAVGCIAFSRQDPTIVFAGMGDYKGYLGTGVLRSTDSGQSWNRVTGLNLPAVGTSADIEVSPTDSNRVYLAQYSAKSGTSVFSSGLYLSSDGGSSWSRKLRGLPRDLAINPSNPNIIYVGMSRQDAGGPAGLYRSTDGGNSWANILASPYSSTFDAKVAVASEQIIYFYTGGLINNDFGLRVLLSTDGGATWSNRGGTGLDDEQFGYNTYIAVHPSNSSTLFVGTRDLFKSTDGGGIYADITNNLTPSGNFDPRSSNTHIDQHAIAFAPDNPDIIYIGNDGGLSKSTNGGRNFSSCNNTLSLSQLYSVTINPTNTFLSYAGAQDNGLQVRMSQPGSWREIATGDFGNVVVDPQTATRFVSNYVFGNVFRFVNNGASGQRIASNSTFNESDDDPRIGFIAPLTGAGGKIYFGTWRLFRSQDFGTTWEPPAGRLDLTKGATPSGEDVLSTIALSDSNANVIYTGSARGRAMVSTDGGSSWTDITAGLPNRFIAGITVHPTNPSVAYLSLSGFGTGHIFKTTDGGTNWRDISGNLPDIPASAVAVDPLDPNIIYAGTDIGVFTSGADGLNWSAFGDGMPAAVVSAFATHPSGLIQVATYGRGVYEIGRAPAQPPAINAVVQEGKKTLRIEGTNFSASPRVFINGTDRTDFLTSSSSTELVLKGKPKKLGLVDGDNTIKVVTAVGESTFILRR